MTTAWRAAVVAVLAAAVLAHQVLRHLPLRPLRPLRAEEDRAAAAA